MDKFFFNKSVFLALLSLFTSAHANTGLPHYDHIVLIMEENHSYNQVVGSHDAPYINQLIQESALFTNFYYVQPGSQPNYLALFSGSTQNAGEQTLPKFQVDCLGSILLNAGKTFVGYCDGLPHAGFDGYSVGNYYLRTHNPFTQFATLPETLNQPFTSFPTNFHDLPTFAFVVPSLLHDAHTPPGTLKAGDAWLKAHFADYIAWAKENNSLLIVTFDEPGYKPGNSKNILTFFIGAHVKPGHYSQKLNHYNLLRTIEDIYGLKHLGHSATAAPITNVWQ